MKKILATALLSVCVIGTSSAAYQADGWQWYKDHGYITYDDLDKKYQEPKKTDNNKIQTPVEQLADFKKDYANIQAQAVMDPTPENVAVAMKYRQYMFKKSEEYGVASQQALLMDPTLSSQLDNPTAQIAQQVLSDKKERENDEAIRRVVAKKYGIFFFYMGEDVVSQAMAPALQEFADSYDIPLIGVTMDGVAISAIKDNRMDKGQSQKFDVKAFPAVFIANPTTQKTYPAAYGFISMEQLKKRVYNIVTRYGKDKLDVK